MRIGMPMVALGLVLAGESSRAWSDEKSHRAAAEEMLEVVDVDRVMTAAAEQMLAIQLKADPRLKPLREVMKKFFAKHLSYAAIKNDLIQLYTAEFTETELKEITAFHRTPTGRKTIEKVSALMQKGAELGEKRVQENLDELRQMIAEELKMKPRP